MAWLRRLARNPFEEAAPYHYFPLEAAPFRPVVMEDRFCTDLQIAAQGVLAFPHGLW
jgi:hypothetical protein